ncbi:Lipoprotein-releasing system ATP-binding protein LolD [Vibrio aerogenes CECT 7868]|uniref:Lipoprotein-releasing system ATP-binding protein LolD n=1 Tax=Vibrio aerogenes CECT 7868 TaxID=1216006 RepID=A0A1M5ZVA4_9VIBR|nr:ABC transporter ATP-binding protein [Vibrio aerogenes]SHI28175.1 Lipoprotein-releasing system ATP-binding protein LolD [Vibrio aerogenes CECT 7868]
MKNAPVISARSLVKTVSTNQQSLTIVKDVSFDVFPGESVAIVGASGAGKSTLMAILSGLDMPVSGEVKLFGRPLQSLTDEERAVIRSESVGFIFQNFLLIPSLSALENVTLPCLLRGENEDTERAKRLLDAVGLSGRLHHTPAQLSGGEQQRVAIARAFMLKPALLFADEPTGNLDQTTAAKVIDLLFQLNEDAGTTLMLVTHDLQLAARCQRRLKMHAGQVEEMVS